MQPGVRLLGKAAFVAPNTNAGGDPSSGVWARGRAKGLAKEPRRARNRSGIAPKPKTSSMIRHVIPCHVFFLIKMHFHMICFNDLLSCFFFCFFFLK